MRYVRETGCSVVSAFIVLLLLVSCNTVGPFKSTSPTKVDWAAYDACDFAFPECKPGLQLPEGMLSEITNLMSAASYRYRHIRRDKSAGGRTLILETLITELRFPSGPEKLLLGSDAILSAELTLRDKQTGNELARKKLTASWQYQAGLLGFISDMVSDVDRKTLLTILTADLVGKIEKALDKTLLPAS